MHPKPKKFYRKTKPRSGEKASIVTPVASNEKESRIELKISAKKREEFPKNYRSITETLIKKEKEGGPGAQIKGKHDGSGLRIVPISFAIVCIFSIVSIIWIITQVKQEYKKFEKVDNERKNLQVRYNQLEETAITHPGSRDIYLQMALVSYQLKDIKKAQGFVERALVLDPNFEAAKRLESLISQ